VVGKTCLFLLNVVSRAHLQLLPLEKNLQEKAKVAIFLRECLKHFFRAVTFYRILHKQFSKKKSPASVVAQGGNSQSHTCVAKAMAHW
jgi:hypothetical protein